MNAPAPKACNVVLTVGNSLMGDDGAGPLLCERMEATPVPGWTVIDGGSMPENVTYAVKAMKPQRLLIVDVATLGLAPGEMRFVDKERIRAMGIASTHNLPLSFIMDELEQEIKQVVFLGIQPQEVGFCLPVTDAVHKAVERIHVGLAQGLTDIPWLA